MEHSRSKDMFQRVALKRLTETQLFEDELKEMSELNKILLARNQELEAQLAKKSWEKLVSSSLISFRFNHAQMMS
jgi:hypothetical protein